MNTWKRILKKRARLAPVRLETDTPLSTVTEKFLLKYLNLTPNQVFVTSVPLDMGYAWGLPSLVDEEIAHELTMSPLLPLGQHVLIVVGPLLSKFVSLTNSSLTLMKAWIHLFKCYVRHLRILQ